MDAIDGLGDAIEATRTFLTPVRLGTWLELAAVVVFVSSLGVGLGATIPGSDFFMFTDEPTIGWQLEGTGDGLEEDVGGELPADELAAIALALGGLALVLWLCYAFLAGVMEFVFLESLRSGEIRVRRYFVANLGNGMRLFLFRLGLLLAVGALGAAPGYVVAAGDGSIADLSPGLFGLYSLYGGLLYVGHSIGRRFTDEFVAPIMLLEDEGVLGAWSRFWGTLRSNWAEYAVYLVLAWFLYVAALIGAWTVVGVGLFVLAIPIAVVLFLLVLAGPIGLLLLIVVGPLALAVVLLFLGLVWAPITTFFQYYALLLLGDTDAELDLVPEQRAAIRANDTVGIGRNDRTDADRGPTRGGDRRASDEGTWRGSDQGSTDPWADSSDGGDTDPWRTVDDDDAPDPWDEPTDEGAEDRRDETDDAGVDGRPDETLEGDDDSRDDDRTW